MEKHVNTFTNYIVNKKTFLDTLQETITKESLLEILESFPEYISPVALPETGYIRQKVILGDLKAKPPIPAIIPISPSGWWKGIKNGIYPTPKKLSANVTAWKVEDIRELIEKINSQGGIS